SAIIAAAASCGLPSHSAHPLRINGSVESVLTRGEVAMRGSIDSTFAAIRGIASAFAWSAVGAALFAVATTAAACWYAFVRASIDCATPMWSDIVVQHFLRGAAFGALVGFLARCADDCNPFASELPSTRPVDSLPFKRSDVREQMPRTIHVQPVTSGR